MFVFFYLFRTEKSIKLHEKCSLRTIGYRERIAKDRFGNWTNTTLMEYRSPDEIVKETDASNKDSDA